MSSSDVEDGGGLSWSKRVGGAQPV